MTDSVAENATKALIQMSFSVTNVATCRRYWLTGELGAAKTAQLSKKVLAKDAIEYVVSGPLQIVPLESSLVVRADSISLGDYDTYFEAYIQAYLRAAAAQGSLSFEVELGLRTRSEGAAGNAAGGADVDVTAKGRVQIDELLLKDLREGQEFLRSWRLRVEGIDFASDPRSGKLLLEEVAIAGTTARIAIDRDGRSNLDAIFGSDDAGSSRAPKPASTDDAPDAPDAPDGAGFAIGIDRVRLDDIGLDFIDLASDPQVETGFEALSGTIDGLSSDATSRAKVDLAGRFRGGGPIEIEGEVNPLSEEPYADLKLSGAGLELSSFSGYSGRFVGYGIAQGRLALDLEYKLENRRLEAENRFELQRFRFGEKVESRDATNLPVTLAAAVMRDPKGNIKLDLPIRGASGPS